MRLRRFAVAAIVSICIGGPAVEMFDRWDQTLRDGNDTEANAVLVALCFGIALATGTIVAVGRIRALSLGRTFRVFASHPVCFTCAPIATPIPTGSPPTPLRV